MKDYIINNTINFICKYNSYDETKLEELKYGLVSVYLLISKLIVIIIISALLGILKEMIIFTLLYIPIRAVSFGLHTSKSWICLLFSILLFVGFPTASIVIEFPIYLKIVMCIFFILLMYKNSPADTHKRPIINPKRRIFFKYSSVIITIIYSFLILFINNNFISNCLIFSLLMQNLIISPIVYKLFKMPYDNYKNYIWVKSI